MSVRRRLASVTPEDRRMGGRPILYGFGYRHLVRLGKLKRTETITNTIRRGVPLHDPVIAVAWALARRGRAEDARNVLAAFGHAETYRVRYRTIVRVKHGPP